MRARNIKPGLYKCVELAELPVEARYLFTGLWCLADCNGRLKDSPKYIKAEIYPYDEHLTAVEVDGLLAGLHRSGFIIRYSINNGRYIEVVNFSKHQNPHKKERESGSDIPGKEGALIQQVDPAPEIPELDREKSEPDRNQDGAGPELAVLIPDSGFLIPDSPILIPENAGAGSVREFPKPEPDKTELMFADYAKRIHGRHPIGADRLRRDLGEAAVAKKLREIMRHEKVPKDEWESKLVQIDRNHAAMCKSSAWTDDGGQYVKSLSGWMAPTMGRYNVAPATPPPIRHMEFK